MLFIAYHIPNQWVLERVARKVREETGVLCVWINPGPLAASYLKDVFDDAIAVRGHGGEPSLSLMRFLTPAAIDMEETQWKPAATEFRGLKLLGGNPSVDGVSFSMSINWDDLYPQLGGFGNPLLGGADFGRQMFERLVADLSKAVEAFRAIDTMIAATPPGG